MTPWPQGAVDVHVHASPSIFPGLYDAERLVAEAQAAGMRGLLLKAHEGSTAALMGRGQTRRASGSATRQAGPAEPRYGTGPVPTQRTR